MSTTVTQAAAQALPDVAQADAQDSRPAQAVQAVGIAEAAQAFGVSADTIRRRLRKGELRGEQLQTPQGFVWQVLLPAALLDGAAPADKAPPRRADATPTHTSGGDGAALEVRRLEAHVTDLRAHVQRLEAELDARRREVSELHTLLGMAQRALPASLGPETTAGLANPQGASSAEADGQATAPPSMEPASATPAYPQPAEPPGGGPRQLPWWQRIWRLGGIA